MLEASGLSKRYQDGTLALDNLNLEIRDGEIFCLLGANGAGKTTTINLFMGFINPSSGSAVVDGIRVADDPLSTRTQSSYVPENVSLYGSFTARQNLDLFARLGGHDGLEPALADRALIRVGLAPETFSQRVRTFSKGMRQKLGIAIAIVKEARNVLLDEPTSGLDPKAAAELMTLLHTLREEGRAILMSTHDIFRARACADRIGIMKEGRLVMMSKREELRGLDLEELYLDFMDEAINQ